MQALLRWWRDTLMTQSVSGRTLISWYYQLAPALCQVLDDHPWLASGIRVLATAGTRVLTTAGIAPAVL